MEIAILFAIVFGLSTLALAAWNRSFARRAEELAAQVARLTADRDEARGEAAKKSEKLGQKTAELDEVKEKLRVSKLKLHEERDSTKRARELDEARAAGEREAESRIHAARVELEGARSELKVANAELDTYRAGKKKVAPAPAPAKAEPAKEAPAKEHKEEPKAAATEKAEPGAEEKARQESTERQLVAARRKIEELDGEVKRTRGRAETNNRVYLVAKGELEASKDRLRTMEERHNALARENDVLRRALEKLQPAASVPAEAPATAPAPEPPDTAATQ